MALHLTAKTLTKLGRLEEALDYTKQAMYIKTTSTLLSELQDIEEKLGTEKNIIKENDDEHLEFVEDIKDSNFLTLIIRVMKCMFHSALTKRKWLFVLLSLFFFILYKNKIKILSLLGY